MNVDPQEIQKFSELAQDWWDPKGPMRPLHELNPLRLSYILKHAEILGKNVGDIGCGAGILTESLARAGAHVTGIDLSLEAIQAAKAHAMTQGLAINYQCMSIEDFAAQENKFDVITCMELLEHVPNPREFIESTVKLLNPNGVIFFSTINRNWKSFFTAIVGAEYILNVLPKGTHHYQQFIRPSELSRWAEACGLVLRHLQGISYHPIKNEFSLSDSVEVNYMMVFEGESRRKHARSEAE